MSAAVLVFIGGGLGALLRFFSVSAFALMFGSAFPFGTVFVNVAGSCAMGLVVGYLGNRTGISEEVRLFFATGLLGGFTTFSAFSLDFVHLWQRGEMIMAIGYAIGSVLLSIFALLTGLALARAIFS